MQKVNTLVVIPHYWMDNAYHDTVVGVDAEVHSNYGHFEIIVKKMSFVGYQAFRIKPECIHDLMELIDQKVIDALVNSKLNTAESYEYE